MDKTKAVMEERMSGGKSKTVVYPFDEAVHYTNEGAFFLTGKPNDPRKVLIVVIFHAISTQNLALMRRGC